MESQMWWQLFWQQIIDTDALQWMAVSLGVAEVLLAKSNKIALYPVGIAGTILSVYILLRSGLYADSFLNVYYIIMSVYGWWYWVKKKNMQAVRISYCNRREWKVVAWIVVGSFAILVVLLKLFTPSTVPVWDAWISATAWAGMWLLSKRKIENWILLNISNFFAIPLLINKELPMFAVLTLFLFVIAILGYFDWQKIVKQEKLSFA